MSSYSILLALLVVFACSYSAQSLSSVADKYAELSKTKFQSFNVCEGCVEVVGMVEDYGCSAACKALPPPLDFLCDFIIGYVCEDIVKWITMGESADKICTQIGFCSTKCSCGQCTEYVTDRCLSVPAVCPVAPPAPHATDSKPKLNSNAKIQELVRDNVERYKRRQLERLGGSWCLGSQCSNATYGCCLTCL